MSVANRKLVHLHAAAEPICLEVEYEEDELEIEIKFKETPQMQVKGGL